jgi:hypothetical protein
LYSTEIVSKESLLYRAKIQDQTNLQKLEGLNYLLTAIERWLEVFHDLHLLDWIGIPFSIWTQFSQCLTILFKLSTLNEHGWNTAEARKRADVLDIMENLAKGSEKLTELVDLVDIGENSVFFKAPPLLRGLSAKFAAEMTVQSGDSRSIVGISDDFVMCFVDDPWLMEMFVTLQES